MPETRPARSARDTADPMTQSRFPLGAARSSFVAKVRKKSTEMIGLLEVVAGPTDGGSPGCPPGGHGAAPRVAARSTLIGELEVLAQGAEQMRIEGMGAVVQEALAILRRAPKYEVLPSDEAARVEALITSFPTLAYRAGEPTRAVPTVTVARRPTRESSETAVVSSCGMMRATPRAEMPASGKVPARAATEASQGDSGAPPEGAGFPVLGGLGILGADIGLPESAHIGKADNADEQDDPGNDIENGRIGLEPGHGRGPGAGAGTGEQSPSVSIDRAYKGHIVQGGNGLAGRDQHGVPPFAAP